MLSLDQRRLFAAHGWLVVRGAVSIAAVDELAAALEAIVPERRYVLEQSSQPVEIPSISRGSTRIAAHARDPELARLAGQALGAQRTQLLQDTVLIKPARSAARVEWHQDYSYFTYLSHPRAATLRLALTPCTSESGCLRVIDGSHAWGLQTAALSFHSASVEDTLALLPIELREQARAAEMEIELQPGDVSLHHCLLFHGSAENRSAKARKTLVTRYFDSECRLVPEKLPAPEAAAYFKTDSNGHLSGTEFPVLHDSREDPQ
jgi:ectoine hydroxylase-related dioxygenase (phytanoyl-CoA dioxygenase family)